MSFRDDELMKIFRISLDALNQAKSVTTDERFALMEAVDRTSADSRDEHCCCSLGTEFGDRVHDF